MLGTGARVQSGYASSIVLMGGSVTAGAADQNAPGRGHLRAADADREQVIEALKVAFVRGRLAKDKFDAGVGLALASQTYDDLAAVTAEIPADPAGTRSRSRAPAASATPAVPAGRMTGGSSIARTVRARRWPMVLVAGVILVILGVRLVHGEPRPGVIFLGVMLILQAAARGLVRRPLLPGLDGKRERRRRTRYRAAIADRHERGGRAVSPGIPEIVTFTGPYALPVVALTAMGLV
jgi:hypothetical protein